MRNIFAVMLATMTLLAAPSDAGAQLGVGYGGNSVRIGELEEQEDREDVPPPLDPNCVAKGVCMETVQAAAARLKADGPQAPSGVNADLRRVQGFVREGWPVVVDFEPARGTRTDLLVVLYEAIPARIFFPRKVRIVMDKGGLGGRRLFTGRIELPEDPSAPRGAPVGVASYEVVSRRLKANGKVSRKRAPVTVYALGAGPKAVGSITLTDVTLGPGAQIVKLTKPGPLKLGYRYQLKAAFDLVAQDVARQCKGFGCSGVDTTRWSPPKPKNNVMSGEIPVTKPGIYRLNVRAWQSCPTLDFSKCGDAGAWATGQSARIRVD
jgi:hypothetical protein